LADNQGDALKRASPLSFLAIFFRYEKEAEEISAGGGAHMPQKPMRSGFEVRIVTG